MLLCDECHNRIDKAQIEEHTAKARRLDHWFFHQVRERIFINQIEASGSDNTDSAYSALEITPPASAQLMHEKLKDSNLNIIEHAGHLSNMENPGEFNNKLQNS